MYNSYEYIEPTVSLLIFWGVAISFFYIFISFFFSAARIPGFGHSRKSTRRGVHKIRTPPQNFYTYCQKIT